MLCVSVSALAIDAAVAVFYVFLFNVNLIDQINPDHSDSSKKMKKRIRVLLVSGCVLNMVALAGKLSPLLERYTQWLWKMV